MIDGGAHVGETAVSFSDAFPEAVIYSFEPTLRSFEALQHNTRQNPHIRPINAALGPETGRANLNVNNCSQTNSFLKAAAESRRWVPVEWTATTMTQEVTVFALDDFVPNQLGSCVDLLKLDVQGYELMVLQGAKRLLTRGEIPLIYLEICHVPQYREQTSLPDLYDFLYKYGYRLVSIYPIEHDVRANKYRLSSNLLFIQESYGRSKSS
ncbi:MAG TPA: FkbM family methyltransferase [Terriglobales bacterium]|nr:FkbM family methyltransferase [Terriglobales bacterium]